MSNSLSSEYHIVISVILFLIGLCVGSFLNVCIYRIPFEKSIVYPSSGCPNCKEKLQPKDMIPVLGYLMLKGKCRYCEEPISVQYPIIEILTGIIWLIVYLTYGFTIETAALLYLYSVLIAVAFIDLKHMIIPNGLVITGLVGGIVVFLYHTLFQPFSLYESNLWYTPIIGMLSASGILFIVALIGLLIYGNDGAMGMGDVKLFLPIGLFLGWKLALLALFLSIMIGGIISIILLIFRIKDRKSAIPFGPFIIISTFIAGLYGNQILGWYFSFY